MSERDALLEVAAFRAIQEIPDRIEQLIKLAGYQVQAGEAEEAAVRAIMRRQINHADEVLVVFPGWGAA